MTTQTKKKQSIFPDYPREQPAVDENGFLVNQWNTQLNALFQALQRNFKDEGILFPPLSEDEINTIESIYTPYIGSPLPQNSGLQQFIPDISGQTVFDTTNRVPKQFIIQYDNSTPENILSAQWLIMPTMINFAGDPNALGAGAAGVLNWMCFDTVGKILYICTGTGSATGVPAPQAVWTAV